MACLPSVKSMNVHDSKMTLKRAHRENVFVRVARLGVCAAAEPKGEAVQKGGWVARKAAPKSG